MKNIFRSIVVSGLCTIALTASAANWVKLSEADDGDRLLIDLDTFTANTDGGQAFIGAIFQVAKGDGSGLIDPTAMVIPMQSCASKGGMIQQRTYDQQKSQWVTKKIFYWSSDGNRFYDFSGVALCTMLKLRMEESSKSNGSGQQKPNKKFDTQQYESKTPSTNL